MLGDRVNIFHGHLKAKYLSRQGCHLCVVCIKGLLKNAAFQIQENAIFFHFTQMSDIDDLTY